VEQSRSKHLDDETELKNMQGKLVKAEAKLTCNNFLLQRMVCQLGVASENESEWNENVEKLQAGYKALQNHFAQEDFVQKAARKILEEKVQNLENERSDLYVKLEVAGRQLEEFAAAGHHVCDGVQGGGGGGVEGWLVNHSAGEGNMTN